MNILHPSDKRNSSTIELRKLEKVKKKSINVVFLIHAHILFGWASNEFGSLFCSRILKHAHKHTHRLTHETQNVWINEANGNAQMPIALTMTQFHSRLCLAYFSRGLLSCTSQYMHNTQRSHAKVADSFVSTCALVHVTCFAFVFHYPQCIFVYKMNVNFSVIQSIPIFMLFVRGDCSFAALWQADAIG